MASQELDVLAYLTLRAARDDEREGGRRRLLTQALNECKAARRSVHHDIDQREREPAFCDDRYRFLHVERRDRCDLDALAEEEALHHAYEADVIVDECDATETGQLRQTRHVRSRLEHYEEERKGGAHGHQPGC